MFKKRKICFLLNKLNYGCGPYQRAIRFKNSKYSVDIISLFDSQNQIESTASKMSLGSNNYKLIGLRQKGIIGIIKSVIFIVKQDYVLIHASHRRAILCSLIARIFSKNIKVVGFEGIVFNKLNRKDYFISKILSYFCDGVICVSKTVYQDNANKKNNNNRIKIYNGVDLKEIIEHKESKKGGKELHLVMASDFRPEKKIEDVILALDLFNKKYPLKYFKLQIFGAQSNKLYTSYIKKILLNTNISNRVKIRGLVTRQELYKELWSSDLFLLSSSNEGLSESLVQAMACKLPVICSNIKPNKEVITNNSNGLVYELGNINELCECIKTLYSDHELCSKFSKNSYDFVREHLNINDVVISYSNYFEKLIKNNGPK
tara:strand:- start:78 stop:1199 length:1122 start_codon:yes stop_codon:yes gene_type:complete